MKKCFALMIFLPCFLLLALQNLEFVHAVGCAGRLFNVNSTYARNRHNLFSTLASKVVANGRLYNDSLGQNPNRVHALVFCTRGDDQACISCVQKVTRNIQTSCPDRMDSFQWGNDDVDDKISCLVRSSNHTTFRKLELRPAVIHPSPDSIEPSKNMTLFTKQWEATVNQTIKVATESNASSLLQYFGVVEAEFTEFPKVYMLMQCTPDITSPECKICLENCVAYFKTQFWGRQGGAVSRPSCLFRWDLYPFHGAFDNATIFQAPPRVKAHANEKKGKTIRLGGIIAIVVPAFITLLVFIGLVKFYVRRRKRNNEIYVGSAEYSESDCQYMLRFDLGMILMATDDFSSENKLGQGGFGTVYKVVTIFFLLMNYSDVVVSAVGCAGSFFNASSTFRQNRDDIFSTLADKVIANGGFYNASLGNSPNRVYALVLCQRGYDQQACSNCVQSASRGIQTNCPDRMDSFTWDKDVEDNVSCLVRTSNPSTFGKLELRPAIIYPSPLSIETSNNMTIFEQEWDGMVNRTVKAATDAETSSVIKYFGAGKAEFTEFRNVYMLMQCTPDITSQDCKTCLRECVTLFKNQFSGRQGGEVNRPSCFFRWDFYTFHGAFGNVTRVPAPPRPPAQEKESSATNKKGISNELIFVFLLVASAEYSESDGQIMLRFSLGMILTATDDFSSENKLGQGGFGTVHKGILPNGQEIAVKRLAKGSGQGDTEFKNEVSLLTRLQHKNLVKLLGFCSEGDEEILIYELVHNSSLDHFIFDEERRSLLTWEVRFRIIEGIARGLLYLHEDSQLKIIHRDLKASNILLDVEMNPKVADFGTARLFDADETRAETRRIAGTRGYMAPEYLNHGQISAKSDVYSFGVMLLEMICGERNNSFEGEGLAAYAWKRWVEGKPEIIIDPLLMEGPINEIIKLIQIGLLCVQENAAKRPIMSSVIVWFGSETIIVPLPKSPAMSGSQCLSEDGTMSMSNVFTELSSR
ncbi:hypothetical protein Bca52824_023728 [Brassica carinata]|uniref:Cysteine-rich receptor-like protein kinase 39 n=1 Tax=Brassica carinata TaxID=52824 RepID=A0A8X7VJ58_BRACI|nr:hypothetical protein Bca52824_023728 [Brassica carinata]